ncbi:MAG: hypothetical protein AAF645_04070 [Myxococcota bacterium]
MTLPLHTLESAPEASQPILEGSKKSLGFVPNLYAVMAESPELLKAYGALSELFQASSFSVEEQTVVWQTFNVEHACHYCVPAHTAIAHMQKVDPAVTEALRNRSPLPNARLETLRDTALELVRNRGPWLYLAGSGGCGRSDVWNTVIGPLAKNLCQRSTAQIVLSDCFN